MPRGNTGLTRHSTLDGSDGVIKASLPSHDRSARRARREKDRDDRRYLSKGSPDRDQHGRNKGGNDQPGRLIGRTKGGMNTKLQAICDSKGCPRYLFVTAGQVSDYMSARAMLKGLPLRHRSCRNRHLLAMNPAPKRPVCVG